MSRKGAIFIIIFVFFAALITFFILFGGLQNVEQILTVFLFVLAAIGSVLFNPIKDELNSFFENLFIKKSVYRICIFGRAGSGKTTLIETAFTLIEPDRVRRSTDAFDYYNFKVQLGLKNFVEVAIADYKGQNPSQIVIYNPPDFFGAKGHRVVNALLFIVDLVPRKVDDQGNALSDKFLLEWLKDGDTIGKIQARIAEHYDYINEATLEMLFSSLYSENLKNVRFLINKLDLVNKLVDDGYVSLGSYTTTDAYSQYQFELMIKNVTRACTELKIDDFLISTISAKNPNNLRSLVSDLLEKRS